MMIRTPSSLAAIFGLAFLLAMAGCGGEKLTPVCDGSKPVYNLQVKPIITANCNGSSCHGAGSPDGDFTTYAGLSVVCLNGKFDQQVLERQSMPRGGTLTQDEINILQCWSDNGFKEN